MSCLCFASLLPNLVRSFDVTHTPDIETEIKFKKRIKKSLTLIEDAIQTMAMVVCFPKVIDFFLPNLCIVDYQAMLA